MKHAYLVLIHKNFLILEKMMKLLDDSRNDFYILLDKKVKGQIQDYIHDFPTKSKVYELERQNVYWGGVSAVEAEMKLLQESVKGWYDYYHFIQGADFPIKTKTEIFDFYEKNQGYEFVEFQPVNYEFAKYKCDYYHFFVEFRHYRTNKILRFLNHGVVALEKLLRVNRHDRTLYHGSALFSITHPCAEWLLSNEQNILKRYRYTLAADEVFLQTEIMNSEFRNRVFMFEQENGNGRYIDWERREGNSPYTFRGEDFELLISQGNAVFARKFDEKYMGIVIQLYQYLRINDGIEGRVRNGIERYGLK